MIIRVQSTVVFTIGQNLQTNEKKKAGRCSILQSCTKIWINLTAMFHFSLLVKNGTSGVDNLNMEHANKK